MKFIWDLVLITAQVEAIWVFFSSEDRKRKPLASVGRGACVLRNRFSGWKYPLPTDGPYVRASPIRFFTDDFGKFYLSFLGIPA